MTTLEFVKQCEAGFIRVGKLSDEQAGVYLKKLQRFSHKQLAEIYDKVIETCTVFPKVAHIYSAAEALGYLERRAPEQEKFHTWEPADCAVCRGEGRVSVIFGWFYKVEDNQRVELETVNHVFPYSSKERIAYKLKPSEYECIKRCSCPAGAAKTIQACIPRMG